MNDIKTVAAWTKKYSLRRSGTNLSLQCKEHGLVQVVHSGTTLEQLHRLALIHEDLHPMTHRETK